MNREEDVVVQAIEDFVDLFNLRAKALSGYSYSKMKSDREVILSVSKYIVSEAEVDSYLEEKEKSIRKKYTLMLVLEKLGYTYDSFTHQYELEDLYSDEDESFEPIRILDVPQDNFAEVGTVKREEKESRDEDEMCL